MQVVNGAGALETHPVRVGVVSRVAAQIVSGLEPGEQVVVGPSPAALPATRTAASPGAGRPMMGPRL